VVAEGKKASLHSKDFRDPPKPLDLGDKKAVAAVSSMTFPELALTYLVPTNEKDDYFDVRCVPSVWLRVSGKVEGNRLFLKTTVGALQELKFRELVGWRKKADESIVSNGNEPLAVWLDTRPGYDIAMSRTENRKSLRCWKFRVSRWLSDFADGMGITKRKLFLAYSCKVLLDAGLVDGETRALFEKEVRGLFDWVDQEITTIKRYLEGA